MNRLELQAKLADEPTALEAAVKSGRMTIGQALAKAAIETLAYSRALQAVSQ